MPETRNIDDLIEGLGAKRAEIKDLGTRIKKSGTPLAVLFIDLVDSAGLKESQSDEDWLGRIYAFLQTVAKAAVEAKGKVVKRIGDELLVTFEEAVDCEAFIDALRRIPEFQNEFPHKIAADYGVVYHLKFAEGLADDPYGRPVDRCARLAKAAQPGAILCSADYRKHVPVAKYTSIGAFVLKGFSQRQEIFLRTWDHREDIEEYLRPLLGKLNDDAARFRGFRYVGRKHSPEDFKFSASHSGRPFLLRELVNLPCLPYSLKDFSTLLMKTEDRIKRDSYIGYLVNWSARFESYSNGALPYALLVEDKPFSFYVFAHVPPSHLEMLRELRKGDVVHVRGVLMELSYSECTLDYVEWTRSDAVTIESATPIGAPDGSSAVAVVQPPPVAQEGTAEEVRASPDPARHSKPPPFWLRWIYR